MKIAMICFSLTGQRTGEKLLAGFGKDEEEAVLHKKSKYLPDSVGVSVREWAGEQFAASDALIFIGACGIAVRSIAPFVAGKKTDPAVLVIDECGKFVISLLSGHLGGANELATRAARILEAVPVITTATDRHKRFAVDDFARKNGCAIFHMKAAKEVSAALLAGERVGFYSEFPWEGGLPLGLEACDQKGVTPGGERPAAGIAVTVHRGCLPFAETTQVVPRAAALGMGCRRDKEFAAVREAAERCLAGQDIFREAVFCLASIDKKKDEPALTELSREWEIPFWTFLGEELAAVPGAFSPSPFVKSTVGVDNVCERSAVLAAGQGRLIQKKLAADGVTAALAIKDWRMHFE